MKDGTRGAAEAATGGRRLRRALVVAEMALALVLLALVACAACAVPAGRATRVDPMVALRGE